MGRLIVADTETRSDADLKRTGVFPYARHPSTEILCYVWADIDARSPEDVHVWRPSDWPEDPALAQHVRDGDTLVWWNAAFDRTVWNLHAAPLYGWPELTLDQTRCAMAEAAALALPLGLDKASKALLGDEGGKDKEGRNALNWLGQRSRRVGHEGQWNDDPDRREAMERYAKTDVLLTCRLLRQHIRALSVAEKRVWDWDQTVNERGMRIDRDAIEGAFVALDTERHDLEAELRETTRGHVETANQLSRMLEFLRANGLPAIENLDKAAVNEWLPRAEGAAKRVLEIRQTLGMASVAKLRAMIDAADPDDRCRGLFQYHGATTGRWGGRRIQTQNMPRDALPEDDVDRLTYKCRGFEPNAHHFVSRATRGLIVPADGKSLWWADYNQIEARLTAWFAGEPKAMKVFREHGDPYLVAASDIYGRAITKEDKAERQIGKVAVLALGFGGAVGAFQSMARTYGVVVADDQAQRIVDAWRAANGRTKRAWYSLMDAAVTAVRNPGKWIGACDGKVHFGVPVGVDALKMRLPSKRELTYWKPRETRNQFDRPTFTYWAERQLDHGGRIWSQQMAWHGILIENAVQAAARDVMVTGAMRLEKAGLEVVGHTHDEIILEVENGRDVAELIEQEMARSPTWATDLPVGVEVTGPRRRYGK